MRDIANKLLGICPADPAAYGGFNTEVAAAARDSQYFWRLGQILYTFVPHKGKMNDRSCTILKVFVDAAEAASWSNKPAQLTQENCEKGTIVIVAHNCNCTDELHNDFNFVSSKQFEFPKNNLLLIKITHSQPPNETEKPSQNRLTTG